MGKMRRTTIYLPDGLKRAIEREGNRRGITEAEVIREALREHMRNKSRPRPKLPLLPDGFGEELATRVDELLEGFGEDHDL